LLSVSGERQVDMIRALTLLASLALAGHAFAAAPSLYSKALASANRAHKMTGLKDPKLTIERKGNKLYASITSLGTHWPQLNKEVQVMRFRAEFKVENGSLKAIKQTVKAGDRKYTMPVWQPVRILF
jgi:hypothetical protein